MTAAIHQGHVELGDAQLGATLRLEPGGVTLEIASTGGTPNMPERLAILLFTSSTGYFTLTDLYRHNHSMRLGVGGLSTYRARLAFESAHFPTSEEIRSRDWSIVVGDIAKILHVNGVIQQMIFPEAGEPGKLADRVFAGVRANDYAQFEGLISLMAEALGREGLGILKARFEELASKPPAKPNNDNRRVIGISSRGPIFQDDYEIRRHARLVQTALTEIADALGDVDGYAARFSAEEHANPAIAARIAERLLAANRAEEAMAAIDGAETGLRKGGHWPDWQRVRIDVLDALRRSGDAQNARWAIFERDLNAEYLRAFIKRLPDFDDKEAESRALAHVCQYPSFHQALAFLIDWPAHDLAAEFVLARHGELDGDHYWLLTPAADALEQRHPLSATLMLRAMIDFSLDRARAKRYGHAARHLQTCEYLAKRIEHFGDHFDHEAYVAGLRLRHGRKSGFWDA